MRVHFLRTVCFSVLSIGLLSDVAAQVGVPVSAYGSGSDRTSTRSLPRSREDRLDPEEARPEKENTLAGIKMLRFQGILYYYKDGVFYRPKQSDRTKYNEVETPMGISVPDIPATAKAVKISGQVYFNVNGIYFKEYALYPGGMWYMVIGKDDNLHTLNTDSSIHEVDMAEVKKKTKVGDVVHSLPSKCRTVTINGFQFYLSPDQFYYAPAIVDNRKSYMVFGK